MKKLKIILNCNITYIILFIINIICILNCPNKSIYNEDDHIFQGIIKDYTLTEDKLTIKLNSKEDLIGTLYIQNNLEYLKYKNILKTGLKIEIKGTLKEINNNTIPYTFNYKKYLNNKNIYYLLNIEDISIIDNNINIIYKIRNKLQYHINKIDKKGYLNTFILGNKNNLELYDKYQRIGVAHLFSISGMHIGLFSLILLKIFKKFKAKNLIVIIILITYGFIIGYSSSLLRCLTFLTINKLLKYFKIYLSDIKVLFITCFIIILINNKIIYDIGFLYSITTVGGIFISHKFIQSNHKLLTMFKLSIITFLFSLPITLSNYYSFNILSIFFNMIYIPYISTIIYPLSLICLIIPKLYWIFDININILEGLTNTLDKLSFLNINISFNIIYVLIYYLILLIFIKIDKKRYLIYILILLFIRKIEPYFNNTSYIYYFDVQEGDASLIISPNMKDIIMIDTGGILNSSFHLSDNIISFLKYKGINHIDYLILSHGDYDHMGEAIYLVNNFHIETVIFNCGSYNSLENDLIKILNSKNIKYYSCIKELNTTQYKLNFLSTIEYDNENDNSNVIYINDDNYKYLFMGDATQKKEKDLLNKYNLTNITFLKVGHHGSNTSSSIAFINQIKPQYSIISVGRNNRYGHPNKTVLENLKTSQIYRTDQDGTIEIKINKKGYQIKTYSP